MNIYVNECAYLFNSRLEASMYIIIAWLNTDDRANAIQTSITNCVIYLSNCLI